MCYIPLFVHTDRQTKEKTRYPLALSNKLLIFKKKFDTLYVLYHLL